MKKGINALLVIIAALLMCPYGVRAQEDKKTKEVIEKVRTIFSQFKSVQDLVKVSNVEKIKKIPDVVDATTDEEHGRLVVTLYNKEKKVFYNPLLIRSMEKDMSIKRYTPDANKRIGKTVWIGNGLHDAFWYKKRTDALLYIASKLKDSGFDVVYSPNWNDQLAASSDIILYHGHGSYVESNGTHWINTGFPKGESDWEYPFGMYHTIGLVDKIIGKYTPFETEIQEQYLSINEDYIKSHITKLNPNACVYLALCNLLDGNDNMAQVFLKKGAAAVVAYKEKGYRSAIFGAGFLDQLAQGKSLSEAYDYLQNYFESHYGAQKEFASGVSEAWDYFKERLRESDCEEGEWGDQYFINYSKEKSKNIVYVDIEGREELIRLYKLLNGDKWDDAAKKNWCSNQPITTWAGVRVSSTTTGINVNINSKLQLPEDLRLENFKRIESIFVPEGTTTDNLTIKECTMLVNLVNCHANNNLVVSGCPLLQSVDLKGAKTVSISDCDNLAGLALDYAPDVETLSVKNCKKLSSIQCFCSKAHPSKLKHLNIENCDNLYGVTLNGCPDLFGTLDLADCKGLKSLSLTETGIREIKVGYLDQLHVRETPIYQTYESIPDWTKHVNRVDSKYTYGRLPKGEGDDKPLDYGDGYKYAGVKDGFFIYYKQNYDDGHGFYHEKEPKDSNYWPF